MQFHEKIFLLHLISRVSFCQDFFKFSGPLCVNSQYFSMNWFYFLKAFLLPIVLPSKSPSGPWHSSQVWKSAPVLRFHLKSSSDPGCQLQKSVWNVHVSSEKIYFEVTEGRKNYKIYFYTDLSFTLYFHYYPILWYLEDIFLFCFSKKFFNIVCLNFKNSH